MIGVTDDIPTRANLGGNRFAYVAGKTGKWSVAWDVAQIQQIPDCGIFKYDGMTATLHYVKNNVK